MNGTKFLIVLLIFVANSISKSHQELVSHTEQYPYCQQPNSYNEVDSDSKKSNNNNDNNHFRAATFEHYRIDLPTVEASVDENLEVFGRVAKIAADKGAQIIVFPEDGLFDGSMWRIAPVLEQIPDPDELNPLNDNPCIQSDFFPQNKILVQLSCIARENQLYLVANYGTKQACKPATKLGNNQTCPESGQFAYNTNVVFDNQGKFIKRYRKWNLFVETFDRANQIETVWFDSPFGRFGLFTCFDMMFRKPAIELVERYRVDTILFPTWWYDELPLLSATQFQDGWSLLNNVNLIASNIHLKNMGSVGSGIYSSSGEFISTGPNDNQPKLLIANLPKYRPTASKNITNHQCAPIEFEPKNIIIESKLPVLEYKHSNYKLLPSDTVKVLQKGVNSTKQTECNNEVCCTIDYEIDEWFPADNAGASLVLIIRDSLRIGTFKWYEQVCALATLDINTMNLAKPKDIRYLEQPLASFKKLKLTSVFNTRHVYPVASNIHGQLVRRADREFNCDEMNAYLDNRMFECKFQLKQDNRAMKILSFGMYGRPYERDQIDYSKRVDKIWRQ